MLKSSQTLNINRTICYYVRTNATLNSSKLLDIDGGPESITTSFGWMMLIDDHPEALLSSPGGSLGSDFSELESVQSLP
jgi:hypothetical protein